MYIEREKAFLRSVPFKLIWHFIVLNDSQAPTKIIDNCPPEGHKMGKFALILRKDWLIEIYVVCLVRQGEG